MARRKATLSFGPEDDEDFEFAFPVLKPTSVPGTERFEANAVLLKVKPIRRISALRVPDTDECVPFIRLSGDWLDELGFEIGTTFRVLMAGPGTLILQSSEV
jgi:hypothetical protein